jgi:hypothetical protein
MKKDTCLIRMNLSTLKKLQEMVPPTSRESAADYFFRLASIIEDMGNRLEKGDYYD